MGITSLVLGIVSILIGLFGSGIWWLGCILALVGIILGAQGRKNPETKGIATGGYGLLDCSRPYPVHHILYCLRGRGGRHSFDDSLTSQPYMRGMYMYASPTIRFIRCFEGFIEWNRISTFGGEPSQLTASAWPRASLRLRSCVGFYEPERRMRTSAIFILVACAAGLRPDCG